MVNLKIDHAFFLFGVTPGVDSFCAISEQSINNKMMNKIKVEMSTTNIYLH